MIISIVGPNTFLLQQELKKLVKDFVDKHGDLALERLDGEEVSFEKLTAVLQSLPFLSAKKLVIIRSPSANKEFSEQLETLLPTIPETNDIVLVELRPDKRTVFYKTLKKHTDFHEFNELREQEMPKWLVEQASIQGATLKMGDAAYLVQRVGANQNLLSNELKKLLIYNPDITRATIDLLTEPTPASTIFELLDAAFAGDTKRALALYEEQRALKVEPQQIMAMLAWQLHILAVIKTAGERSVDDIAKEAKLNPYVVRKSAGIAKKLTYSDVKKLVERALKLDIRLKSESIDANDALQHFLLTITS
jgi:DNA polymerase III delta subunit